MEDRLQAIKLTLAPLEFISKKKVYNHASHCDLIITKSADDTKQKYTQFRFVDGSDRAITSTGYMQIAKYKKRLYFRESNLIDGYKVVKNTKQANGCAFFKILTKVCDLSDFVGQYDFKYDPLYDLYYVVKED